jgi:hypothetical protein
METEKEWTVTPYLDDQLKRLKVLTDSENLIMVTGEPGTGKGLFIDAAVNGFEGEAEFQNLKLKVRHLDCRNPKTLNQFFEDLPQMDFFPSGDKTNRFRFFLFDYVNKIPSALEPEFLFSADYLKKVGASIFGTYQEKPEAPFMESEIKNSFLHLHVSPLRERPEDTLNLISEWMPELFSKLRRWEVLNFLRNEWPGNAAALKQVLTHIRTEQKLSEEMHFPSSFKQPEFMKSVTYRYLRKSPVSGLDISSFTEFVGSLDPDNKPYIEASLNEIGLSLDFKDTVIPFKAFKQEDTIKFDDAAGYSFALLAAGPEKATQGPVKPEDITLMLSSYDDQVEIRLPGQPAKRELFENLGFKKAGSKEIQDFKRLLEGGRLILNGDAARKRIIEIEKKLQSYFKTDQKFIHRAGGGHYDALFKVVKSRSSNLEKLLRNARDSDEAIDILLEARNRGEISQEDFERSTEAAYTGEKGEFDYSELTEGGSSHLI